MKCRKVKSVRWLASVAILGALSAVVMLLEFMIPVLGPTFLRFDFSEVPVMIGAFALGPVAGLAIEAIKVSLNLVLDGSWSFGIGELANFLVGVSFVFPASLIYRFHKTRQAALIGMLVGVVTMATTAALLNLYLLLPTYAAWMGMTPEAMLLSFSQAIPYITDLKTGILFGIIPFNLVKSLVITGLVMLLYKRVSPLIKGREDLDEDSCEPTK